MKSELTLDLLNSVTELFDVSIVPSAVLPGVAWTDQPFAWASLLRYPTVLASLASFYAVGARPQLSHSFVCVASYLARVSVRPSGGMPLFVYLLLSALVAGSGNLRPLALLIATHRSGLGRTFRTLALRARVERRRW